MPLAIGGVAAHDDSMHSGSAKRDAANGVAPLDAGSLLPSANLPAHGLSKHTTTPVNLLAAIAPTFTNFTTNPGTNAEITTETNDTMTTAGVTLANQPNYVTFDLGSLGYRSFGARARISSRADLQSLDVSLDNVTWYNISLVNTVAAAAAGNLQGSGQGYMRYMRYNAQAGAAATNLTVIKMWAYTLIG